MRAGKTFFKGEWITSLVQDDIVNGDRVLTEIFPINPENPTDVCENTRIRQTRFPGDGSKVVYRTCMYEDGIWSDWRDTPYDE